MIGRTFVEFEPGDNAYELGNGAVRELAGLNGITLSAEPNDVEIQEKLFNNWGTQKAFADNMAGFASLDGGDNKSRVAELIEQSGITDPFLPRRIDGDQTNKFKTAVIGAGALNWIYRRAKLLEDLTKKGHTFDTTLLIAGSRQMTLPTEVNNPFVTKWQVDHEGNPPTEADYMYQAVEPWLRTLGVRVVGIYDSNPKAGFKQLVVEASGFLNDGNVLLSQNSPASSTFGDVLPVVDKERLYFAADGIKLARTPEEEADSLHYQNVLTAPSALVRWVKSVNEAK
jgi:hypothetical protein